MKESIYVFQYVVLRVIIGPILLMYGNDIIINNNLFIIYSVSTLFAVVLFWREVLLDVRDIKLEQLDQQSCIGVFILFGEILTSVLMSMILKIDNKHQVAIEESASYANSILFLITVIILAPVVEEMFYRFCIFKFLGRYKTIASSVSVFLFAFGHIWEYIIIGDFQQAYVAIPYIIVGIGLVVAYRKSNNICYPILLHVFLNAISQLS